MTAKRDAEKHPWKRYLLKYFMVTLGILLDAIALELFLVPNSVLVVWLSVEG